MKNDSGISYINQQIDILLKALNDENYSKSLTILEDVSIGKHLRHVYEFYKTIESAGFENKIDYACRQRNQDFEHSIDIANACFEITFAKLNQLDSDQEIFVMPEFFVEEPYFGVKSSIGRELMYAFDHAIHHLAIIKIGAKSIGISLPKNFGVAPSTIKYKN